MSDPRPSRLRIWWRTLRPATLTAGVAPVLVGSALAYADGAFHAHRAAAFLVGFVLLQVASNLINDAADFRSGADGKDRLGPPRAAQQGWLTVSELTRAAVLAMVLAGVLIAHLVQSGGWPVLAGGIVAMLGAVTYTAGPVPLAYHGGGDFMVFFIFGMLGVGGSYYVQAEQLPVHVGVAAAIMGALSTAILIVNNLRDRLSDARSGKRTLIVRFGERFGRLEYTLLVLGAYAAIPLLDWYAHRAGWGLPLLSLPLAVALVRAIWRTEGAALNPLLGGTARLGLVFALLWGAGLWLGANPTFVSFLARRGN